LSSFPRITFGLIILNGHPFVRYNLRALYPFAHQIIVVEGAAPGAAAVATDDGHSIDGSLEELYRFKQEEDRDDKIEIITKDGFWAEKDEMSQAYAERTTGDYLWQVDVDEFYQPEDMREVLTMLRDESQITAVYFKQKSFWGGFDYVSDGWYLRQRQDEGPGIVPRIFRWQQGYHYYSHRPVTVLDEKGRDVRKIHPVNGKELSEKGIFMYHYSLVFPKQVREKSIYYGTAAWAKRPHAPKWADEVYSQLRRPFQVHNVTHYPSWLERFQGQNPPQIEAMRRDIESGSVQVEMRPTADIERLLDRPGYKLGRFCLKMIDPFARRAILARRRFRSREL
jgi:hypothetical protein